MGRALFTDLQNEPGFSAKYVEGATVGFGCSKKGAFETVHEALFDAMWVHEKNLSDMDVLAEIAEKSSLSLEDIEDAAIKNELKANTNEVVQRGAFGAPTFFVGDQMFFGNDRFDFIEEAIKNL